MNYNISPGYLGAAGTRLLAGRNLTLSDDSKAPKVALINRKFAEKVFGSVDKAVGGHFKYWAENAPKWWAWWKTGDTHTDRGSAAGDVLFVFAASGERYVAGGAIEPRSSGDFERAATTAAWAGCGVTFYGEDVNEEMSTAFVRRTCSHGGAGRSGAARRDAGGDGIFGMASYTVSKRLREIGIRIALGARRKQVLRSALGRAFVLLSVGSLAGIGLEFWRRRCCRTSFTRRRRGIRWCWVEWF